MWGPPGLARRAAPFYSPREVAPAQSPNGFSLRPVARLGGMDENTPTQAVTPDVQATDGQRNEPEQPTQGEHAQLTPDALRAELEAARKEAAKYRTQLRQQEKAASDAEAKRMAEEGKYKDLYESIKPKAEAAAALQERLDAITAQTQAANARRIEAIPENMRSLVPAYDDPLKVAEWLDANAAILSKPAAPPLDGRAGGNGGLPALDETAIKAQAVRLGLDPESYYRQAQMSAAKR